jgi:UDPglucose 6-dehydrogenase
MDPAHLGAVVNERRILDGRNALDPTVWRAAAGPTGRWGVPR